MPKQFRVVVFFDNSEWYRNGIKLFITSGYREIFRDKAGRRLGVMRAFCLMIKISIRLQQVTGKRFHHSLSIDHIIMGYG